jgi:transcriptional regulator with XRE-family HTH domain
MTKRSADHPGQPVDAAESKPFLDVVKEAAASIPPQAWLREDHLARRMTQERERRGWSQERLAREMKRHGFALPQSSISKIENPAYGTGRRAITVDEAVGLSVVYGMPLLDLLAPIGRYGTQAVRDLADGAELAQHLDEAHEAFDQAVHRVASEWVNNEEEFAPVLAAEARRLCEALGVSVEAGRIALRPLLAADPKLVDGPARHQLTFLQAVIREARRIKPKPGRGPRRAKGQSDG